MKFWSKSLVCWLVLSLVFIFLVDLFTIRPHVISGNGNLGLLIVGPTLIIFIFFAKSLWQGFGRLRIKSNRSTMIIIGAFVLFIMFCILEYQFAVNLIKELGGSSKEPESRIYRFPWLNQYTNTLFINVYTFGILAAGITFLKIILNRIKRN
ncbi:hypothetical protein [Mesobacillus selenatarsenatis]|uniref:Uncharacterized protein n=1 Tax=Mesobacillus selenatarsenatis TaxID=388741 RepID=A0A846T618_9BACI|nr:hypothetical protein [Mesobacillus selenatarsenatis]NKE04093.1 hypothetical protein [Mesobacillus selenatarsenatis]